PSDPPTGEEEDDRHPRADQREQGDRDDERQVDQDQEREQPRPAEGEQPDRDRVGAHPAECRSTTGGQVSRCHVASPPLLCRDIGAQTPMSRHRTGVDEPRFGHGAAHSAARESSTFSRDARRAGPTAATTPASAARAVMMTSSARGSSKRLNPESPSASTITHPKNSPTTRPSAEPNMAMITASQRTVARSWRRLMPTARSRPSSRMRSWIDRASVLAMPS